MIQSNWREVLTDSEADELALAEYHIASAKAVLRGHRAKQREIMNRAVQRNKRRHLKSGVDTEQVTV